MGFDNKVDWFYGVNTVPPPSQTYIVGTIEHEITELMGRTAFVGNNGERSVMDLFRYSAPGVRALTPGTPGHHGTAYLSYDKGVTRGGTWNADPKVGDLGDWAPNLGPGPNGNDAFAGGNAGVILPLTMTDLKLMNVLGWNLSAGPPDTVPGGVTDFKDTVGKRGRLSVASGGDALSTTVDGLMVVSSGGYASGTVVKKGGTLLEQHGALVSGTQVDFGGVENVDGVDAFAVISSGGSQSVSSGGQALSATVDGVMVVLSGGYASGTVVEKGGILLDRHGGLVSGTQVDSGGVENVDGVDASAEIFSGGSQTVSSGGQATHTLVHFGGTQVVDSSGTTEFTTLNRSATELVSSGGVAFYTAVHSGGILRELAGGESVGATINSGTENVQGLSEATTIFTGIQNVSSGGSATVVVISGGAQNVLNGGIATYTSIFGGSQNVSSGGSATITAISGGTQEVFGGGIATNTSVYGGIERVEAHGSVTATEVFSGGSLRELAGGSSLSATIDGGREGVHGSSTDPTILAGLEKVDSGGVVVGAIVSGGLQEVLSGGLVSNSTVHSAGSATVQKGGTLDGGLIEGTLINGGLVEATTKKLTIQNATSVTNTGTIDSNFTIDIVSSLVNNKGGTIEANGIGDVFLHGATIDLGTLATASIALIETLGSTASVLDGVVVTSGSIVQVSDGSALALQNTITNKGTIRLDSTGHGTTLRIGPGNAELTGSGRVQLSDNAHNAIVGVGTKLTNLDNTIAGAGHIGNNDGNLTLSNSGTIDANGVVALIVETGKTVANAGTLEATAAGGLTIDDAVINTGSIIADGGNVAVGGKVSGAGSAEIFAGSRLEFKAASSTAAVTFENNATNPAVLILDHAASFAGTVAGLPLAGAANDTLDLQDINFASGVSLSFQENNANTKGVLTVQDGFGDTAKITLMGQYATSNFAKSADTITGTGGTLITMQHIT